MVFQCVTCSSPDQQRPCTATGVLRQLTNMATSSRVLAVSGLAWRRRSRQGLTGALSLRSAPAPGTPAPTEPAKTTSEAAGTNVDPSSRLPISPTAPGDSNQQEPTSLCTVVKPETCQVASTADAPPEIPASPDAFLGAVSPSAQYGVLGDIAAAAGSVPPMTYKRARSRCRSGTPTFAAETRARTESRTAMSPVI
jgi:hypothetical protein